MTQGERRETRIIRCPACERYYRVAAGPPAPGTRMRCSRCGEVFSAATPAATPAAVSAAGPGSSPALAPPPAPTRGRVLVATDGGEFQSIIGEVLAAAGFELRSAPTGEKAWEAIGSWRPHVALLDVALPGVPSFELCDRVRADRDVCGTGLILIASVFQQTRYKRAPTSLYGADDYIEKHHIRDRLPGKVARLIAAGAQVPGAAAAAADAAPAVGAAPPCGLPGGGGERERETLIGEEFPAPRARERRGLERLRENLRRYARIIISDIALYNQELVERGIGEGTFSELLKKEIEEGRRLYLTRVPPSAGGAEHYEEAVRDFIAKRTAAHGSGPPRRPRGGA